jgi:nitric oxide synthase oxygenase domain/subunit
MDQPQISFQVRRDSSETLAGMGERVGKALGCTFTESTDTLFERGEALEASVLGLHITLSHDPSLPENVPRTYVLMGGVRDDIEAEWDIGVPVISIGRYVLGVLTITDGEGWYIATEAELRAEAGLSPE